MRRRLLAFLMALVLCIGLAACGGGDDDDRRNDSEKSSSEKDGDRSSGKTSSDDPDSSERGKAEYMEFSSKALTVVHDDDEGEYTYYVKGKEVGSTRRYPEQFSQDGSVAISNDYNYKNSFGTLSVVTSKGVNKVAEDVGVALLSPSGTAILYTDDDYTIYWYDVDKDKSVKLKRSNTGAMICGFSPDGSYGLFVLVDEPKVEGFSVCAGRNPVSLGKNNFPLAISNDGTYVYYLKVDSMYTGTGTLYVKSGKEEVRLARDCSPFSTFILNSDGSQMIYTNDGKTYITVKGGEAERIFSGSVYQLICPPSAVSAVMCSRYAVTYPVSDLRGQCYLTENGIYYLNEKGDDCTKIVSDVSGFQLSDDGESLIYLKNGRLTKVTRFEDPKETELTDDGDIVSFIAAPDLSAVFYLDDDDELYYQEGDRDPVQLIDDVAQMILSPDGKTLFVVSDGKLYIARGKELERIEELDDVKGIGLVRGVLCILQYTGRSTVDVYTTTDAEPKLLVEDLEGTVYTNRF